MSELTTPILANETLGIFLFTALVIAILIMALMYGKILQLQRELKKIKDYVRFRQKIDALLR